VSEIRPFARHDREQLTSLVNAHIRAVIPGWSVPTSALLNQMEREPGEYIVDPWVVDRETWVAIERDRVAAAAHLHRYGPEAPVGTAYRNAAAIGWLVCWPEQLGAGHQLMAAMRERLDRWSPRVQYLDVSLPAALAYGVQDAWPHIRVLAEEAGFGDDEGRTELQLLLQLDHVGAPTVAPVEGMYIRRRLNVFGAAFTAVLEGGEIGLLEVDDDFTRNGTMLRCDGWADVANLTIAAEHRRKGVATWLLQHACDWLRLGATRNLVAYVDEDEVHSPQARWYHQVGFAELNRTRRGWRRLPDRGWPTASR
jgi:GNAT superfamily N-acetyltransferase